MTLVLNTVSGVLHRSPRCAGRDTRFHVGVIERPGETLIAVQDPGWFAVVKSRCRKCLR